MRSKIILVIIYVLMAGNLPAQNSFTKLVAYDTITSANQGVVCNQYNITPYNGGYYVSMITDYLDTFRTTLVKTDNDLNPLWAKRIHGFNFQELYADSDQNIYVSAFGYTNPHTLNSDMGLAKLDSAGNIVYVSLFNSPLFGAVVVKLVPASDGNLLISGTHGLNNNVFTAKIQKSNGDLLWAAPSGSYDLKRTVQSPGGSIYTINTIDPFLYYNNFAKIDGNGVLYFSDYYQKQAAATNRFTDLLYTSDHHIKILCETTDTLNNDQMTATVLTLDTMGNMLNQSEFYAPVNAPDKNMKPVRIFENTPDLYYIVAAEIPDNSSNPTNNFLVFEFDTMGQILNSYTYHDTVSKGNSADNAFVLQNGSIGVSNSGYIQQTPHFMEGAVIHLIYPDFTSNCEYRHDTILKRTPAVNFHLVNHTMVGAPLTFVKDTLDANRFFSLASPMSVFDGCFLFTNQIKSLPEEEPLKISIINRQLILVGGYDLKGNLEIFNSIGQKLFQMQNYNESVIDLSSFASGCFIVTLEMKDGKKISGRFIL